MLVSLFADASRHGPFGGWGAYAKSNRGFTQGGGSLKGKIENIDVGEMKAVCNGLMLALRAGVLQSGDTVLIQTDSQGAINCFTNRYKLKKDDPRIAVQKFAADFARENNVVLRYKHVKGHVQNGEKRHAVNNICDSLAKRGMRAAHKKSAQGGLKLKPERPA